MQFLKIKTLKISSVTNVFCFGYSFKTNPINIL